MTRSLDVTSAKPTILIVDDEEDILDLLEYNLESEGYGTRRARNGQEALDEIAIGTPDAVILDVMMPVMDGIEFCKRVRKDEDAAAVPVLMLTALSEEEDTVQGLDSGADIYLTKPVSVPVLLSQVRALLRGSVAQENKPELITIGNLVVDRKRYQVDRLGVGIDGTETREAIQLPRREFELLYFLALNRGRVFTRDQLLTRVWGADVVVVDRTVDVHVRKIREKLGAGLIETIKGVGYRLTEA